MSAPPTPSFVVLLFAQPSLRVQFTQTLLGFPAIQTAIVPITIAAPLLRLNNPQWVPIYKANTKPGPKRHYQQQSITRPGAACAIAFPQAVLEPDLDPMTQVFGAATVPQIASTV
jgi:hypothetical protein